MKDIAQMQQIENAWKMKNVNEMNNNAMDENDWAQLCKLGEND